MLKLAPLALLAVALTAFPQQKPPEPGQLPSSQADGPLSLPNTVSAPPFTVADKFDYRIVQSIGLRGLGGSLVGAAIGQATGTPYAWGGGVEGFAKRYASGLAGNLARQSFAFVLESALHEDPRYFPSEGQPKKARFVNALKQVFICKTDTGHSSFAYGRVISTFGSAQLVNTWQPASNGSVGDGLLRGVYGLGADLAYNLLQEFVPFTRPRSLRHH
ncbi:MAG TPA: hypothetical protein VH477_14655 [Bryobacteraceae bacterium]|jgi:hypothetical protein